MAKILWIERDMKPPIIAINHQNTNKFDLYEINEEKLNYICGNHLICDNRQNCKKSFLHAKDKSGQILHVSSFAIKRLL
jgi:hypothetical protein